MQSRESQPPLSLCERSWPSLGTAQGTFPLGAVRSTQGASDKLMIRPQAGESDTAGQCWNLLPGGPTSDISAVGSTVL